MAVRCARVIVLASVWSGFLSGCQESPGSATTVQDSAGVRLTLTRDEPVVFAEVDAIPGLSLGGAAESGPTQFFRIQNIHAGSDGRLWVADGQSGELRIFESDGSHWKTRGGRGEGPGELLQIRLLGSGPGDSVWVADAGTERLTVFSPTGEFVRSERVVVEGRPAPRLFDVFQDGSLLGQVPRILQAASLQPGDILGDTAVLIRLDPRSGDLREYGRAPGPLWLWTGRTQVPIPFTVNASFVAVGDAVHLVSGSGFRVRVWQDGRLLESYGVDRPARPVSDEDVEAYATFVEDHVPESTREDHLTALSHGRRPEQLPGYDRVLAGEDGRVWAQVYESRIGAAHRWDVFDGSRRFLGQVRVPGPMYPMLVTGASMVGVWRDDVGVEYVRTYRLERRQGSN